MAPHTLQSAHAADVIVAPPVVEPVDDSFKWMFRVRGLGVIPDDDADLSLPGADVSISTAIIPEFDISYFFTENFAVELILAVSPHDVSGRGVINGVDMGDVNLLPPTLTAQYHHYISPTLKPYVGAGINYTWFFDEDPGALNSISYDDSFGWVLQAGVDYFITDHLGLNLDVKKVFLSTDVTATTGGTTITGEVDIDPWIVGAGVSLRF